jgi:flagellar protein FliS
MNFMAIKAYENADTDLLVAGSDQFGLVKLLYLKLLNHIYQAIDSIEMKDLAARSEAITEALTIIHVLNSTLDYDKGGEVAVSLSQVYGWSRKALIESNRHKDTESLKEVAKMIEDISQAWETIGQSVAA